MTTGAKVWIYVVIPKNKNAPCITTKGGNEEKNKTGCMIKKKEIIAVWIKLLNLVKGALPLSCKRCAAVAV